MIESNPDAERFHPIPPPEVRTVSEAETWLLRAPSTAGWVADLTYVRLLMLSGFDANSFAHVIRTF